MIDYLLDTNVVSELLKKRPNPAVLTRVRAIPRERLATSAVCVMELRHGAALHPTGADLWARIRDEVLPLLRVLPFGFDTAVRAGDIMAALGSRGEPIGVEDVLIAATALEHGVTVATRNVRHFARVRDLAVESWWT